MSRIPWFALIAFWLLSASLAAQQNSASSNSPHPALPPINVPPTDNLHSQPPCDPLQESTRFAAASYELRDLHLDSASDQFLALTRSCDPFVRAAAAERFAATHQEMSKWWWQMGRHFPPFRWYRIHYPRFWWFVAIGLALLLILALPAIAFWIASSDPDLFPQLSTALYGENRPSRTVIMTPNKLTDTTEANLFGSMLQSSSLEVIRVLQRAGAVLQVRSTALLSLPSDTASTLSTSLPTIKSIDINGVVKLLFYLRRYFGWRVESQVGFCPSAKSSDAKLLGPGRIVASAAVRYAWQLKVGPWSVDRQVDDQYDIDAVAFAIGARIMGSDRTIAQDDALRFTNEKSFGLFMEGLHSLQLYDDETSREQPRKSKLERSMQDALDSLRDCVSQYPDLLPRFYLGVALTMRNQEVYVARLQRLTSACNAMGRSLGFSDLKHVPAAQSFVEKLWGKESDFARPFRDLVHHPWPLLQEASRMFQSLVPDDPSKPPHPTTETSLARAARYNLAQVYGRRGGDSLQDGLDTLGPEPPPRAGKARPEEAAIDLQFACLRESLNIRLLMLQKAPKDHFDDAFKKFEDFEQRIKDHLVDLSYRADLTADYQTQRGYVFYESAINRPPTGPNLTAEQSLQQAAECFSSALELKQYWNPAQIYLALVRRIQAGLNQVYSEWEDHQKEKLQSKLDGEIRPLQTEIDEIEKKAKEKPGEAEAHRWERIQRDNETRNNLQFQIHKLREAIQPEINAHDRSAADRQRQKAQCEDESDELFAVLRGLPWPSPPAAPATETLKSANAPKPKTEDTASREAA